MATKNRQKALIKKIYKSDDSAQFESILDRFLSKRTHYDIHIKTVIVGADERGAYVKVY